MPLFEKEKGENISSSTRVKNKLSIHNEKFSSEENQHIEKQILNKQDLAEEVKLTIYDLINKGEYSYDFLLVQLNNLLALKDVNALTHGIIKQYLDKEYNKLVEKPVKINFTALFKNLLTIYSQLDDSYKISEQTSLQYLQVRYPDLVTKMQGLQFSPEQIRHYLLYRYAVEQMQQSIMQRQIITLQEKNTIEQFNVFDTELGLGSPIEIPDVPLQSVQESSSMQDALYYPDLGSKLYQENREVKSFVDNYASTFPKKKRLFF